LDRENIGSQNETNDIIQSSDDVIGSLSETNDISTQSFDDLNEPLNERTEFNKNNYKNKKYSSFRDADNDGKKI